MSTPQSYRERYYEWKKTHDGNESDFNAYLARPIDPINQAAENRTREKYAREHGLPPPNYGNSTDNLRSFTSNSVRYGEAQANIFLDEYGNEYTVNIDRRKAPQFGLQDRIEEPITRRMYEERPAPRIAPRYETKYETTRETTMPTPKYAQKYAEPFLEREPQPYESRYGEPRIAELDEFGFTPKERAEQERIQREYERSIRAEQSKPHVSTQKKLITHDPDVSKRMRELQEEEDRYNQFFEAQRRQQESDEDNILISAQSEEEQRAINALHEKEKRVAEMRRAVEVSKDKPTVKKIVPVVTNGAKKTVPIVSTGKPTLVRKPNDPTVVLRNPEDMEVWTEDIPGKFKINHRSTIVINKLIEVPDGINDTNGFKRRNLSFWSATLLAAYLSEFEKRYSLQEIIDLITKVRGPHYKYRGPDYNKDKPTDNEKFKTGVELGLSISIIEDKVEKQYNPDADKSIVLVKKQNLYYVALLGSETIDGFDKFLVENGLTLINYI